MPDLICPGPGRIDLPALGIVAREGETVTVPDDAAPSLREQGWTEPKATKAAPKAPKAATQEGDD